MLYHLLAVFIVIVWGTTFISSKQLLLAGLTPHDIIFYRFCMAYLCLGLCARPFRLWADNWKDEALFLLLGLFGGTLYFLTENNALRFTYVSNVSLICSTTPLLTLLLKYSVVSRSLPGARLVIGSLVAFLGVAVVVLNGRLVFRLSPVGDLLCVGSALSWSLYTLLIEPLSRRYPVVFITRKIFFYSLLTLLPTFLVEPLTVRSALLLSAAVWPQLLFLGVVASFGCFMLWNVCLNRIGAIVASNYIYLTPVVSIVASNLVLGERMNLALFAGTALVLAGMAVAQRGSSR